MLVTTFERTAHGCVTVRGRYTDKEAEIYAAQAIAAEEMEPKYSSDNFCKVGNFPVPAKLDGKCFATPFVLDRKSIYCTGGCSDDEISTIFFEAVQQCMFFMDTTDASDAVLQAHLAAITDHVEQCITVDSSISNRWAIQAPADIPQTVIGACFAHHFRPVQPKMAYIGTEKECLPGCG